MRIIAGKHKGRKIEAPKTGAVRPTSEFAREAIFNLLVHGKFSDGESAVEGAKVLDVFSGTGAFGLEALSRGAARVTFIDKSREALSLARRNAENFHELGNVEFIHMDATMLTRGNPHDVALLDPPYNSGLLEPSLKRLLAHGWLSPGALVIAEHDEREAFTPPEGVELLDTRRYGRAHIEILKVN